MVMIVIKRLIFDLDNTLIKWKPEYLNALNRALTENNYHIDPNIINELFHSYEENYNYYDQEVLLNYINSKLDDEITPKVLDDFLEYIGYMSDSDQEVIDTLEYLKDKYEMVVLTRWFGKPQVGGDEIMKPHPDAFKLAMGGRKPSECVVIGDTYDVDLIPAQNLGIKPIFANFKDLNNPNNYQTIKSFKELKDIL